MFQFLLVLSEAWFIVSLLNSMSQFVLVLSELGLLFAY